MRYGDTGVNLEIDLSRGSIEKEKTDPGLTELYLGGLGTNAKIIWDRVSPEVEPFSPDNLLIFSAGLLCGTLTPGANRTIISTISPVSKYFYFSMAGGFWAPELKYAGYDKVIFRGKSPEWVYLWINSDKVELRDASHLLGKGGNETAELIRKELKEPKAQVASIGLAGENRVYMASIELGKSSCSRGGLGAVMGDKRLKAIVVRGTKDVYIARPAEFFEFCDDMLKKIIERHEHPIPNLPAPQPFLGTPQMMREHDDSWHTDNFAWGNARHRRKGYWTDEVSKKWQEQTEEAIDRFISCYNCPMKCSAAVSVPQRPRTFFKCYTKITYAMGAMSDSLDFDYDIASIAMEYGVDSYSTPQVMAFAVELYEAGILTDQDMPGFPSGNEERHYWLLDKIVRREGIGDVLADGTHWAAQRIGKGAEEYAHNNIRKLEQLPLKLGMWSYNYYLMYCTGEKATITQQEGQFPQAPYPDREEREEYVKDWIQVPDKKFIKYYLDWDFKNPLSFQASCEAVEWMEAMHYIDDSLGLCAGLSSFPLKPPYHIHNFPTLISLVTGMDLDEAGLWKIAQRNRTLVRCINLTRGLRRREEKPPEDHWKIREPEKEASLLDMYYKFKGWNNNGFPTKETLDELGLDFVSEDAGYGRILSEEIT